MSGILSLVVAFLFATFNFYVGKYLECRKDTSSGKTIFVSAIIINVANLFFFKSLISLFPVAADGSVLFMQKDLINLTRIVFPIGISFYTFSILGYLIDIRLNTAKAENDYLSFLNFVFFFPKILAGPIEKVQQFISQAKEEKQIIWENFSTGGKLIIWGTFQKIVVADRISIYIDNVYSDIEIHSGVTIIFCIILYSFQIYADFSGYTNIARGIARLFGYNLLENFQRPLLARSVSDFWHRWHISLSSWVNNYIYTPLSMYLRNTGISGIFVSLFISFFIIGLWHGFLWTFVLFGISHGILLSLGFLTKNFSSQIIRYFPVRLTIFFEILITFSIISATLVLFRVTDFTNVQQIFGRISSSGNLYIGNMSFFVYILLGIFLLLGRDVFIEFFNKDILEISSKYYIIRALPHALVIIVILMIGVFDGGQFIYLKF